MTDALYRLAQLCIRRKLVVIAVWMFATIALVIVSQRLGDNTNDNRGQLGQKVSKPSTESSELIGILAAMAILACSAT